MKYIPGIILFLSMLVSCGPSRHAIHLEMRHPSKSGLDLAGKIVSVVHLENGNPVSDSFAEGIADGFAYSLDQDYGTGDGSIGIYRMRVVPGGNYASKDTLVNLLMDTGADMVFLIDTLSVGRLSVDKVSKVASASSADSAYISTGRLPFSISLYCFDAMDESEKVYSFNGTSVAVPFAYSDGRQTDHVIMTRAIASLPELGFEAGMTISSSFKSEWKVEQYSVIYFDSARWYKALEYVEQYYLKEAMEIWLELLDTNDMLKRSAAAYNLALASYMLGDLDLASEWLDRSDADNKLSVSDSLRKRIDERR